MILFDNSQMELYILLMNLIHFNVRIVLDSVEGLAQLEEQIMDPDNSDVLMSDSSN